MTTDSENSLVWLTQEQINDHIKSFGMPGYKRTSGAVKGSIEAPFPASDILVRKVEGDIVPVAGSQRLAIKLQEIGEAKVRFPSGREAIVVRTSGGQLVEKQPHENRGSDEY